MKKAFLIILVLCLTLSITAQDERTDLKPDGRGTRHSKTHLFQDSALFTGPLIGDIAKFEIISTPITNYTLWIKANPAGHGLVEIGDRTEQDTTIIYGTTKIKGYATYNGAELGGGNAYDQDLNTSDDVVFRSITGTGSFNMTGTANLGASTVDGLYSNDYISAATFINSNTYNSFTDADMLINPRIGFAGTVAIGQANDHIELNGTATLNGDTILTKAYLATKEETIADVIGIIDSSGCSMPTELKGFNKSFKTKYMGQTMYPDYTGTGIQTYSTSRQFVFAATCDKNGYIHGVEYYIGTSAVFSSTPTKSVIGIFSVDSLGVITEEVTSAHDPSLFSGSTGWTQVEFENDYYAENGEIVYICFYTNGATSTPFRFRADLRSIPLGVTNIALSANLDFAYYTSRDLTLDGTIGYMPFMKLIER